MVLCRCVYNSFAGHGPSRVQLGPGGFNLSGARESAERIVHRLAQLDLFDVDEGYEAGGREALASLDGNHFALLGE